MENRTFAAAFTEFWNLCGFDDEWWREKTGMVQRTLERWKNGERVPYRAHWRKFHGPALEKVGEDREKRQRLLDLEQLVRRFHRRPAHQSNLYRRLMNITDDFRAVFGSDLMIYLIYSELTIDSAVPKLVDAYEQLLQYAPQGTALAIDPAVRNELKDDRPLVTYDPKGNHGKDGHHFRAERSACVCEVRAASYLSAAFARFRLLDFRVVGNVHPEVHQRADLSFVSFGALTNSKTQELLADKKALVAYGDGCFVSQRVLDQRLDLRKRLHKPTEPSDKEDYGMIIRIQPTAAPAMNGRVWIGCTGVRELGTSAAAWILANKWKQIASQLSYRTGSFACLVRANVDQGDEFANLEWVVERPDDLAQHEL